MTRRSRRLLMALALLPAVTQLAQAQTRRMHIGPHFGYDFKVEELVLGGQFSAPIATRLEFYPSFDWYFVDPGTLWAVNADLKYRVAHDQPNWLYLGGGLNVARRKVASVGSTKAGFNLFAGAESLRGIIHPFGEARATLKDHSTFQIVAGLNITLGRH